MESHASVPLKKTDPLEQKDPISLTLLKGVTQLLITSPTIALALFYLEVRQVGKINGQSHRHTSAALFNIFKEATKASSAKNVGSTQHEKIGEVLTSDTLKLPGIALLDTTLTQSSSLRKTWLQSKKPLPAFHSWPDVFDFWKIGFPTRFTRNLFGTLGVIYLSSAFTKPIESFFPQENYGILPIVLGSTAAGLAISPLVHILGVSYVRRIHETNEVTSGEPNGRQAVTFEGPSGRQALRNFVKTRGHFALTDGLGLEMGGTCIAAVFINGGSYIMKKHIGPAIDECYHSSSGRTFFGSKQQESEPAKRREPTTIEVMKEDAVENAQHERRIALSS